MSGGARWIQTVSLCALLALVPARGEAGVAKVHWVLTDGEPFCDAAATTKVACGAAGTYYFYPLGAHPAACDGTVVRQSLAKVVPVGGAANYTLQNGPAVEPAPLPLPGISLSAGGAAILPGTYAPGSGPSYLPAPDAVPSSWIPCKKGSCFDPHEELEEYRWVAVVDWPTVHGWSVGWTLRSLLPADVKLGFFSLSDLELNRTAEGGETTDVHVIGALCGVLHDLADRPPLVVNLSFGHLPNPADVNAACDDDEALQCEVGRLLELLYRAPRDSEPGTVLVAAAGNHHELLFPAAHQRVIPAGMLDLERLEEAQAAPAWETPPPLPVKPLALMPGNGLCLSTTLAGVKQGWAAPGGSSYSSAVFSAWMARALLRGEITDPLRPALWFPSWWSQPAADCFYRLRQGSTLLETCARVFDDFFEPALFSSNWTCPTGVGSEFQPLDAPTSQARFTEGEALGGIPSLIELSRTTNTPAPAPPPCASCDGPGLERSLGASFQPVLAHRDLATLQIALSGAAPLPEGIAIDGVFLRTGESFHPIELSAAQLYALGRRAYSHFGLLGAVPLLEPGEQPALVFVLAWTQNGATTKYWSAAPILLLEPR